MQNIYLDYAATAPTRLAAASAAKPFLCEEFGNPSSLYEKGQTARYAIEFARQQVAEGIGALASEIIFTSSGTESNNWILSSFLMNQTPLSNLTIAISSIEHPSILKTAAFFKSLGVHICYLPIDHSGRVILENLEKLLQKVSLCSVMWVNNETGVIQPIEEIGEICQKLNIPFHVDAVQALGHFSINLKTLPIDYASFSGHKIGGLKGCGALYVKSGKTISSFIHGGGQERDKRAGTENIVGIVSFGAAMKDLSLHFKEEMNQMNHLSLTLNELINHSSDIKRNTNGYEIPSIWNLQLNGISAESFLNLCDLEGISLSSGSACSSGAIRESPVLAAMNLSKEAIFSSFRLSMGYGTTIKDLSLFMERATSIIHRLKK